MPDVQQQYLWYTLADSDLPYVKVLSAYLKRILHDLGSQGVFRKSSAEGMVNMIPTTITDHLGIPGIQ